MNMEGSQEQDGYVQKGIICQDGQERSPISHTARFNLSVAQAITSNLPTNTVSTLPYPSQVPSHGVQAPALRPSKIGTGANGVSSCRNSHNKYIQLPQELNVHAPHQCK